MPGFCALLLQSSSTAYQTFQQNSDYIRCNTGLPFSFVLIFISVKNDLISRNTHLLDQFYHKHSRMCINIEACLFQDIFSTLHPVNGLD